MRKFLFLLCIVGLLTGCSSSTGSFEKGDKEIVPLIEAINKKTDNDKWDMPFLNEQKMSDLKVEQAYQLDMTKLTSSEVHVSVVPAQLGEIAFFQVTKEQEGMIKQAIAYRMQTLKKEWSEYIPDNETLFATAKQGRIGQYYYFILGTDSKKVVHYIQNED